MTRDPWGLTLAKPLKPVTWLAKGPTLGAQRGTRGTRHRLFQGAVADLSKPTPGWSRFIMIYP